MIWHRLGVLPQLNQDGELPPGVHIADWTELERIFSGLSLRRVWLAGRLRSLIELAKGTGKLRRVFIWGSFVTAKPGPRDLDVLLIMSADFEVEQIEGPARAIFDSVRARLIFEADVFWARVSIGEEMLGLWLET